MYKINNTFGLDVSAEEYLSLHSIEEAQRLLPTLKDKKYFIVGGGSNLLFTGDYEGVIVHSEIEFQEEPLSETEGHGGSFLVEGHRGSLSTEGHGDFVFVKVPGSMVWDDFVKWCCEKGYWGVENLSYIPGEVGASAIQNIGAYGVEVKDVITHVFTIEVETGKLRTFDVSECKYGYRESIFKTELWQKYLVYAVEFKLSKKPQPKLDYKPLNTMTGLDCLNKIREAIINIRREKLPDVGVIGSAGSFFKNPVVAPEVYEKLKALYPTIPHFDAPNGIKIPAAWLIDNAGLKGYKLGRAQVYEKQPLVIVNPGGATAKDVVDLAQYVINTVFEKYGVRLSPEVNYIN